MNQPKWIVQGHEFIKGFVGLHFELRNDTPHRIKGGGYWYVDKEAKVLYLFKASVDFGQCTKEEVLAALKKHNFAPSWKGFKVCFTRNIQFDQRTDEVIFEVK